MTIKAFLATDSDGDVYMYFIDDSKWLKRDKNGNWIVTKDYPEDDCDCVNLSNEFNFSESFGYLNKYIKSELERIHIPTKDEDPVEIDINLSINWF